ncbi:GNAT family N-acetyltransferase [Streptomyces sp. MNU89]|uniref:GNAT family N-acetyltransferase n=1 Tax=Streptomyces sp. MNU89 TaxID=2560025 RepID=UPI001E3B4C0C|nr:GNAT family N-acetyltransferase [Streptomyces sp. MNU89]MCC9740015.1 GNAT family N-acetyltransferase [Streptomyces sp. MNU89]
MDGMDGTPADGMNGMARGTAGGRPGAAADGLPGGVVVREARDEELAAVAALRWEWVLENEGTPVTTREEFLRYFVGWARENAGSHRCLVVLRGTEVIGMAWLAVVRRVPSPRAPARASGDVQCVYVVPAERDRGLGGRLIDALRELAREAGLERVTVHSSSRAVPAYRRHGFVASPRLLQAPGDGAARSGSAGSAGSAGGPGGTPESPASGGSGS